jgi:hypothetical protein
MKVEEVVVVAETEKVTVVRAESEDIVAAENYQESLFAAVPEKDPLPLPENQSVGAAEREDAGWESWAAEGDLPEEN